MAKHKSRREDNERSPRGLDQNQLMSLLGNVDLNQLSALLSSVNSDGYNINNSQLDNVKKSSREDGRGDKDNTVQLLNSLKGFVSPKRVKIIDKIIEMYNAGEFDD